METLGKRAQVVARRDGAKAGEGLQRRARDHVRAVGGGGME